MLAKNTLHNRYMHVHVESEGLGQKGVSYLPRVFTIVGTSTNMRRLSNMAIRAYAARDIANIH